MHVRLVKGEIRSAYENMRMDAELLEGIDKLDEVLLRFYEWERPSITYGYFVKPEDYLDCKALIASGIDSARRPTGGGLVFHMWDMAFSVLVPRKFASHTLDNYRLVNEAVRKAVVQFLGEDGVSLIPDDADELDTFCSRFCMARPTKYDVMIKGKKIAGAAQRKRPRGFLHQGTIALEMPSSELLQKILLPGTRVQEAMYRHTYPVLQGIFKEKEEAKERLRSFVYTHLQEHIDLF